MTGPAPNRLSKKINGTTLFHEASAVSGLMAGWRRTWENGGAAGGDGQSLESFANDLVDRLTQLSEQLRDGCYRPGLVREVAIPKRGKSGKRVLRIPTVRDRVAQSAFAQKLSAAVEPEFEHASFGYRPGRGVSGAIDLLQFYRRQGFVWTIDADIDNFFDTIPIDGMMDRLERSVSRGAATELIGLWLEHGARAGRGLAQGSPISPVLANLYLDDLDEAFTSRGLRIVRYADDFLVLARDRPRAERGLKALSDFLARYGLRLNREAAEIRDYDTALRFLGQTVIRSWALASDSSSQEDDPRGVVSALRRLALADSAAETAEGRARDARDAGYDAGIRQLSIRTPGRNLSVRNQSFSVVDGDGGREIAAMHPGRVDRIEIGPKAGFDDEAARLALAHAIPLALSDGHGATMGHLAPALAPRARLHLAQARLALDPCRRLEMAKKLVCARLANQRALLRRVNQRRGLPAVSTAAHGLGRTARRLQVASTLDAVRGVEGLGAALYWRAIDRLLLNDFHLAGRLRRRRSDPVNSALDLACSLLSRDITAVISAKGLHPGFGALHETSDYRDACVYDLMEIFRAGLTESLILALCNCRQLQGDMFSPLSDGGVRMGRAAQEKVIRGYEERASGLTIYPRTGKRMSWRAIMAAEADAYADAVEKGAEWDPFLMNY